MKKKSTQMLTTFVRPDNSISDGRPDDFLPMCYMGAVLLVLELMAVYYYGMRALIVMLVTTAACWVMDAVCLIIRRKALHIHDISSVVTGLAISAMLPASVPYTVAVMAAFFAICIAKHPFGGHRSEIFSCAAAGYIFAELSCPSMVLMYPKPMTQLPLENYADITLYNSFTKNSMFAAGSLYSDFELLIGNFAGPMGCTFTVLVAVCALVLISVRAISGTTFFTALMTVMIKSFAFDGIRGVKTVLAGGMLVFGITVLICDCSIVPKNRWERVIYGFVSGLLIIVISEISALENPVVYAAVIAGPAARLTSDTGSLMNRRKRFKSIMGKRGSEVQINETIAMIGDDRNGN